MKSPNDRSVCNGLLFLLTVLVTNNTKAQVIPNGNGVPGVSDVPPVEQAYLGPKINYVRTWQCWKPITDPAQVSQQTIADVKVNTAYVDGQGRVMQTVSKQISPTGKDMVSYKQFDEYGRETIQPLPYVSTATNGDFKANPFFEQKYYYSTGSVNNNQYTGEQIYFGKTIFETSPLGRPLITAAAGNSWAGNNRGNSYEYFLNTVSDSVRLWTIADAASSTPSTSAMYEEGQLYKTVTADENFNEVVEYKDKQGMLILKKVQLAASPGTAHVGWLCTYYIYDDYGLLRVVLQPQAVAALLWAGNWSVSSLMDELCFRYEYDQRNRMIIKKVPGAGEVWMVYDARDRVVMTQDAKLRNGSPAKWFYSLYDEANRPVATGLLNSSDNRATHQSAAYNSSSYPTLSNYTYEELTHTSYDDNSEYSFDTQDINKLDAGGNPWPETVANSSLVYGKPVMVTVKIMGISQPTLNLSFYDEKGRVIQTHSTTHSKREDIITTRYDFSGKPIATYHRHYMYDHVEGSLTTTILTKMLYDGAGRLTKTWKKINDGSIDKLIAENSYDELGQLKSKKLAPEYNNNAGIETLNFEYNIRGWLKSINKDYVSATSNTNWFGQTLSYNHGFTEQQFNGNISGLQWRSKGDGEQRAYGFMYDRVNRLSSADFTQYTGISWNTNAGIDFTANNLSYDANGNILTMNQKGWKLGGSVLIDQLAYDYYNDSKSNKLKHVVDGVNDFTSWLGDFKYDANTKTSTDYYYDDNGNLKNDLNKNIKDNTYDGIEYNHLNLPTKIRVLNKGTIEYEYDATGNKTRKITTEGSLKTVTTYLAGFVYQFSTTGSIENGIDVLQYFAHEEGRIRKKDTGFVFDYFVKDHLGNIRMLLTEEQQTDMYPAATMETANATIEETYYSNLPATRVDVPSGYPANTPPGNAKVAKVSGASGGNMIGPAIILKVMSGDKFNVTVNSWWQSNASPGTPANPLNSLLNAIGNGVAIINSGHPSASQISNSAELNTALSDFLHGHDHSNSNIPRAFVNWLLLDEHFNLVISNSGFEQVVAGSGGCDVCIPGGFGTHTRQDMPIDRNGYLYIYVSNETPNIDVYFDNLQVTHIRGPLIEENAYYPFGLIMSGISSKALSFGGAENKKKFNGIEHNNDFDLNMYDAFYRNLDPQLGRFWQIDPKPTHFESLYTAMGNNPIRNTDFLGDELSGTDRVSAEREQEIIRNSIKGKGAKSAQDLFKLKGMKFKNISDKKLQKALSKIDNADTKKLVEGYAKAINSKDKMFVSVISRTENVNITNKKASSDFKTGYDVPQGKSGRWIDDNHGGGSTYFSDDKTQSLSVVVMGSTFGTKYMNSETGVTETQTISDGESSAHEVLGHGLGRLSGSPTYQMQDAIQMSNSYRRAQGDNNLYRTGEFHQFGKVLQKEVATAVPSYLE